MIKAIIFDFGGVLSEEGFQKGLKAIARQEGLNSEDFFLVANELVFQSGYITGMIDEHKYWDILREKADIRSDDKTLREAILNKFLIRPRVIENVKKLKAQGLVTAILSDQTNWLDEINERQPFFYYFDYIFNSFKVKKDKRDPSIFVDVCSVMGFKPDEVLFVDDNIDNIQRAQGEGLKTIHFRNIDDFEKEIRKFI